MSHCSRIIGIVNIVALQQQAALANIQRDNREQAETSSVLLLLLPRFESTCGHCCGQSQLEPARCMIAKMVRAKDTGRSTFFTEQINEHSQ